MIRKVIIPLLAIIGAAFGLFMVFHTQKEIPTPKVLFPPAQSPFPNAIASVGIIEASSENIVVGTPFDEIVKQICVIEGDYVNEGDILFVLDLRNFEAQLDVAKAQVKAAEVNLANAAVQFSFYTRLRDKRAVSEQMYEQARYNCLEAEANLEVALANVRIVEANIDRSIIRAPVSGEILQVNFHVGEIALVLPPAFDPPAIWQSAQNGNYILMGTVSPLQVRTDIDEADAWKYEKGSRATAFVRGNRNISFPLTFCRVEPYMIVKPFFTGAVIERIDTRVLQIIYQFDKGNLPVYPGQLLDVFIESKPIEELLKKKY